MPVYINCPHCEHPQVVPLRRRGKARFCRQCGRAFTTSAQEEGAHPLAALSVGDLHRRTGGGQQVYVLGA